MHVKAAADKILFLIGGIIETPASLTEQGFVIKAIVLWGFFIPC
jgi:hypothetical protein